MYDRTRATVTVVLRLQQRGTESKQRGLTENCEFPMNKDKSELEKIGKCKKMCTFAFLNYVCYENDFITVYKAKLG
jgi:hypothetical protein